MTPIPYTPRMPLSTAQHAMLRLPPTRTAWVEVPSLTRATVLSLIKRGLAESVWVHGNEMFRLTPEGWHERVKQEKKK